MYRGLLYFTFIALKIYIYNFATLKAELLGGNIMHDVVRRLISVHKKVTEKTTSTKGYEVVL